MHARCMLDRAEHLTRRHADPRLCVAFRSALAGGLPMSGQGRRWAAVRSALQFALLFRWDAPGPGPASYATTGVYSTFELMVRAYERSPNPSFLLCSLLCDARSLP